MAAVTTSSPKTSPRPSCHPLHKRQQRARHATRAPITSTRTVRACPARNPHDATSRRNTATLCTSCGRSQAMVRSSRPSTTCTNAASITAAGDSLTTFLDTHRSPIPSRPQPNKIDSGHEESPLTGVSSSISGPYWSGRQDLNLRPLDPQDVGVDIFTGQTGCRRRVPERSTCGMFAPVQDVWSPTGRST
jgi:hypothetical protein